MRFHNLILYIVKAMVYDRYWQLDYKGGFPLNSKIKSKDVDFLFDAILQLQNRNECYLFFEDLLLVFRCLCKCYFLMKACHSHFLVLGIYGVQLHIPKHPIFLPLCESVSESLSVLSDSL